MTTDNLAELESRLGLREGALAAFGACSPADLARLTTAVEDALRRESEALETGTQEALGFIPRPLRGMATKLLFPGGLR